MENMIWFMEKLESTLKTYPIKQVWPIDKVINVLFLYSRLSDSTLFRVHNSVKYMLQLALNTFLNETSMLLVCGAGPIASMCLSIQGFLPNKNSIPYILPPCQSQFKFCFVHLCFPTTTTIHSICFHLWASPKWTYFHHDQPFKI